jgi:hypothetical protein
MAVANEHIRSRLIVLSESVAVINFLNQRREVFNQLNGSIQIKHSHSHFVRTEPMQYTLKRVWNREYLPRSVDQSSGDLVELQE